MSIFTTTSKKERATFKLSIIFAVLFLDFLFFAAIIPLIPLLFLEPANHLLPFATSLESRSILLGALYSIYPLAQMIFSPFLGAFSDRAGRKKMLLTAYLGNAAGYFLFALGIYTSAVFFLFLGFFIAGATGCNISMTNTIISDLSKSEEKLKRYSLSNMMVGLAFVLGPFFAGQATSSTLATSNLAFFAFLGCGFVSLTNVALIGRHFKNTPILSESKKTSSTFGLTTLLKQDKKFLFSLIGIFLLYFGWYSFIKFFQALFLNKPYFKEIEIFNILSYFGICSVISQLLFSFFLHKFFSGKKQLLCLTALLALSILATAFVTSYGALMVTVTLFSFAYSILCPCILFEISRFGTQETQGRVMGFYQSTQDLAKILGPLLAGCTMALWPQGPALIAPLFIFCSMLIFSFQKLIQRPNCNVREV